MSKSVESAELAAKELFNNTEPTIENISWLITYANALWKLSIEAARTFQGEE